MDPTLRNIVRDAAAVLQAAGVDNAGNEAYYLLTKHIPCTRGDLLTGRRIPFDDSALAAFREDLEKRKSGVPLQYLLGKWEFYGAEFITLPGVLIPRPETEQLVDLALPCLSAADRADVRDARGKYLRGAAKTLAITRPRVLDLCTGSGCVGLTLARLAPDADVTLLDISAAAIDAAGKNAEMQGLTERTHIVQGDILQGGGVLFPPSSFDLITCNPPYIKTKDLKTLPAEVKNEPVSALDGGTDGLTFYRCLAQTWGDVLSPGGAMIAEAGADTAAAAAELFIQNQWEEVKLHRDLENRPRMITARRKK